MKNLSTFLLMCILCTSMYAQKIIINENWKFSKGTDTTPSLQFGNWESICLPHTWNALDGQDGGNNYYRGIGWYQKELFFDKKDSKKQIYLRFGASNNITEAFLNGKPIGKHAGGYTAFAFDITSAIRYGKPNTLLVKVNNTINLPVVPISADFTAFGGLIRNVELIKEEKLHITSEDYGSRGVYIRQDKVDDSNASITVTAKVRNAHDKAQKASVIIVIKDAEGKTVEMENKTVEIAPQKTMDVAHSFSIGQPHLWNGVRDPYLYQVSVHILAGKKEVDREVQPLGIRYYSIDPDKGFFLNGQSYPLRGVSMHEEMIDKGIALSDEDRRVDVDRMVEMGVNYIRLSHYQHGDFTYNYLDSLGVTCWTEIPLINEILDTEEFAVNCETAMTSLIRQLYNHPSIIVWGLSNEINFHKGPDPVPLIKRLNELAHREDPTRLTTVASMFADKPTSFVPDVYSNNRYYGWYYGKPEDIGSYSDKLHQKYPDKCIGISEYGAGGHPFHHQEELQKPSTTGQWHPENVQTNFHEIHLKAIDQRPYIWSTSVWAAYDFASDKRGEGNQPGINDKGLITHDRKIKKDSYYFYKVNWNKSPMVHICDRRFTKREKQEVVVKVYSNCDRLVLKVNKDEVRLNKGDNYIHLSDTVVLKEGENKIEVTAGKDGKEYKDKVIWYYLPENK